MTNPPPGADGEELVEADLPGAPRSWEDGELVEADLPTTSSGADPDPPPEPPQPTASEPAPDLDPLEHVDRAIRNTEETLRAEEQARADAEAERERQWRQDAENYREFDDDPEDSVIDELRPPEPPRLPSFGPWEEAPRYPLGTDPPRSWIPFSDSWTNRFIALVVIAIGGVAGWWLINGPLGGSDDASARGVAAAPTLTATSAPTVAATEAATVEPNDELEATDLERSLALMQITAAADLRGDLWLRTAINSPQGVDPDTLAFLYAFALGAAVQTEDGYNGAYYSVADGASYAEAVFGSPDFPRTSGRFNTTFQIEQADLWITDDGQFAIHLPGGPSGGGLDASLFGPDTPVIAGVSFLEEEGGTAGGGFQEFTLGEIETGVDLPAANWTPIEPDSEPLRLDVPDTSNRN